MGHFCNVFFHPIFGCESLGARHKKMKPKPLTLWHAQLDLLARPLGGAWDCGPVIARAWSRRGRVRKGRRGLQAFSLFVEDIDVPRYRSSPLHSTLNTNVIAGLLEGSGRPAKVPSRPVSP